MIANRLYGDVMQKIRVSYEQIMSHLKETIDPTVGQNLLFIVSDPFQYHSTRRGRQNYNPKFTAALTKILVDKGGEAMWTQADINGKIALFNQALDPFPSVADLFKLLFPSVEEFKRLMAISDAKGNSILHRIYTNETHSPRFIQLMELLMTQLDYFKLLDLNWANEDGFSLFDCVDEAAAYLHRNWLSQPSLSTNPEYLLVPYRVRAMFSKYIFCLLDRPNVIHFTTKFTNRHNSQDSFRVELSPDSTLTQLKSGILLARPRLNSQFLNMCQFALVISSGAPLPLADFFGLSNPTLVTGHGWTLKQGDVIDCFDTAQTWRVAEIIQTNDTQVLVHYVDWGPRWDAWFSKDDKSLQPPRTKTCGYTGPPWKVRELEMNDHCRLVDQGIHAGSIVELKWSRDVVPEGMQPT